MAIDRAYPSAWSIGEKLTSAQMNQVDANATYSLDKRAGQSDSLMSLVVATGSGRIAPSVGTGPDADKTFYSDAGNQIVRVPTLTAARAYTLGQSGATGGDWMRFYVEGTGSSPSGYADIKNSVGTALFRLGMMNQAAPNLSAEGDSADFMYQGTGWTLQRGAGPGLRTIEFTASTNWIVPPNVHAVLLEGWGGGGGGGGGVGYEFDGSYPGGGGGGGAIANMVRVPVVPGSSYAVIIGAGGTCADENTAGSNGGDTIFGPVGATALAIFPGAAGGGVATLISNSSVAAPTMIHVFAIGGAPIRPSTGAAAAIGESDGLVSTPDGVFGPSGIGNILRYASRSVPGLGGMSSTSTVPTMSRYGYGNPSARGYPGGSPGRWGTGQTGYSESYFSGGGGGGGGGGPGGPGATGGSGGNCSRNGGGTGASSGGTPLDAPSNSGAGGGGGGGAGGDSIVSGGRGSNGGSGKLTILLIK